MVFTERDDLLGRGRKPECNLTKILVFAGVGCLAGVALFVNLAALEHFTGGGAKLLTAAGDTGERVGRRNRDYAAPVVSTALGKVRGVNLYSRGARQYKGFYNVPYAEPPIGELRFKSPVPVKPWNETLDCTEKGSMCVQRSRYNPGVAVEGTEDCLHTNIFTPQLPQLMNNPKLPVIVYFFGGGFMHGTANDFNADYFMDEDVVLVIVESRVGALGFLNTGDVNGARGNMGLKDQVMAMKWVRDNIDVFGGDPTRIVEFGTSSGAQCSHAHLLSPMTAGLFSGAMSFSGTMLQPGSFDTNPKETAARFRDAMNCSLDSADEVFKCLQNVTAEEIALGQPDFSPSLELIPEDGDLSDVFFPDTPINLLLSGRGNSVPWIVGVNSAELILDAYSLLLDTNKTASLNENWMTVLPKILSLNPANQTLVQEATKEIRSFYFGNQNISRYTNTRFNLTDMLSDRYHVYPTKISGKAQARQSPVYWYYFTREANVSYADSVLPYFDPPYGVSHADEVQYFFSRPRYPYIPLDSPDADFSVFLVKLWVSFAKTGVPMNPDPDGTQWPKVDVNGTGTVWYNLDDVPKLVEPFTDRLTLWDSFPFKLLYYYDYNRS